MCLLFVYRRREARQAYADNILRAQLNESILSLAIDAADQAKHHCPSNDFTCRATQKIKKIIQQFIGVLNHGEGYGIFRRLPYVQKGANLTLTILIELIRSRQLAGKSHVYIQWDGASENVAKTNLRFFIWLLLLAEHYKLPLLTISVCRWVLSSNACMCVCSNNAFMCVRSVAICMYVCAQ